jgi:hypothetical protein
MAEPLNFLNDFWLVQAMKYSLWLYPTVESLHICGIGMLFGSVVLMDLRLLGVCPNIDFSAISRLGISVSMFGFTLAALTGSMMFITHASDLIDSRLFVIKMCLIFLLLCNVAHAIWDECHDEAAGVSIFGGMVCRDWAWPLAGVCLRLAKKGSNCNIPF